MKKLLALAIFAVLVTGNVAAFAMDRHDHHDHGHRGMHHDHHGHRGMHR
jgi:hypothetical protein